MMFLLILQFLQALPDACDWENSLRQAKPDSAFDPEGGEKAHVFGMC